MFQITARIELSKTIKIQKIPESVIICKSLEYLQDLRNCKTFRNIYIIMGSLPKSVKKFQKSVNLQITFESLKVIESVENGKTFGLYMNL